MKGLTVENLSTGILSEYIIHYAALFPGLLSFFFVLLFFCLFVCCFSALLCVQYNTHKWKSGKKRGKPREHLAHE